MENYSKLEEVYNAVVNDCYDFLYNFSDKQAKESIDLIYKSDQNGADRDKKIYVLQSSLSTVKVTDYEYIYIVFFTKSYIDNIYYHFKKKEPQIQLINIDLCDFCLAYIALIGYVFIFKGIKAKNLFNFYPEFFKNYYNYLKKYEDPLSIQELFENYLSHMEKKENVDFEVINMLQNKVEFSKTEQEDKSTDKNTSSFTHETGNMKIDFIYENNSEEVTYKESFEKLENEISLLNDKILSQEADNLSQQVIQGFEHLETKEQLSVNSVIINTLLDVEKKKVELLDNVVQSLKKNVINLSNPYELNLWRKIANIILKNLFVILIKNKYTISQNTPCSIKNDLAKIKETIKLSNEKKKSLDDKIAFYANDNPNKKDLETDSPCADKKRSFNLITINKDNKGDITCSLSSEFLFYLKEKGNEADHFDEKILNFVLFNNLDIYEMDKLDQNKEISFEEKEEITNKEEGSKVSYKGKTTFTAKEIIQMLKCPLKFKKEINLNEFFSSIYEKTDALKELIELVNYTDKIKDLSKKVIDIENIYEKLIKKYENYFIKNNLNIKDLDKAKDKVIDEDVKYTINLYLRIEEINSKIKSKKDLYNKINTKIDEINKDKSSKEKEIADYINAIKIEIEQGAKLITMEDIFKQFKEDLKNKIIKKKIYKQYSDIFSEKNINDFSINQFYDCIFKQLDILNMSYSIIKRDITNYNLFVEVITKYDEVKEYYKPNIDIEI